MKIYGFIQRLHLWIGLILGVQVFFWMASGAVMSWFHIELVRGERNALKAAPTELVARNYASPGGVIAQADGAVSLTLKTFMGRAVYVVDGALGPALFDAETAARLSPLPRETAVEIAKRDFVGKGDVEKVEWLTEAPGEYRRGLPVWRVTFSDPIETRIYVSPQTGDVLARRNAIWRVYDFFWMLHIMDYEERENFNNPLLIAFATTGLVFAATGLYLVVVLLMRGRYRIGGKRRKETSVQP